MAPCPDSTPARAKTRCTASRALDEAAHAARRRQAAERGRSDLTSIRAAFPCASSLAWTGAGRQHGRYSRAVTSEPSGMFEAMYAGAEAGGARPPWDYGAPRPQLVEWAESQTLAGGGS